MAGACATGSKAADDSRRRLNIVFIMADDLGYGDLGCYGCPDIRTHAIDGLAREGVRFTNFYSNGPECTPTRTALMTGRYQQRVGGLECAIGIANVGRYDDAIRLCESHDLGLPAEETSIARMLKDAGYATALCGKWHLGYEPKFLPRRHGFDYFVGPLGGAVDYFHHTEPDGTPMLYLDEKPIHRDAYMTDLITDEAVGFIQRRQDRPFFLYVAYTAPHTPYQGPNDRRDKPLTQEEWNKGTRATFAEMVERMDRGVGAILEALEDKGAARNTVVVFASDNGANRTGRNAPFSGYKGGVFEGGIRVPCIACWPGVLPADKVADHACTTMDLTASFAEIAGTTPARNRVFDGIDILDEIRSGRPLGKRTLYWRARRGERTWRAVRDGSLKYISRTDGPKFQEYLFDLERDAAEKNNLMNNRPADLQRLKRLLVEWEKEVRPRR
jgi:N-acetylgalactosamine-6-sulfatase